MQAQKYTIKTKEAERKVLGKKNGVVVCELVASCVWTNIAERGAWQNPSVFYSNDLGDAQDMLM